MKETYKQIREPIHPWEINLPGRFTPVYRVDKRIEGVCTGKPVPSEEVLMKKPWNNLDGAYE